MREKVESREEEKRKVRAVVKLTHRGEERCDIIRLKRDLLLCKCNILSNNKSN